MLTLNYCLYIKKIHQKIQERIGGYLYTKAIIIGKKLLNNGAEVYIIELTDYTRIWLFKEEIQIITDLKI